MGEKHLIISVRLPFQNRKEVRTFEQVGMNIKLGGIDRPISKS